MKKFPPIFVSAQNDGWKFVGRPQRGARGRDPFKLTLEKDGYDLATNNLSHWFKAGETVGYLNPVV